MVNLLNNLVMGLGGGATGKFCIIRPLRTHLRLSEIAKQIEVKAPNWGLTWALGPHLGASPGSLTSHPEPHLGPHLGPHPGLQIKILYYFRGPNTLLFSPNTLGAPMSIHLVTVRMAPQWPYF